MPKPRSALPTLPIKIAEKSERQLIHLNQLRLMAHRMLVKL